jgi:two-component system, NarL family, sensor histidine kinase UhpB
MITFSATTMSGRSQTKVLEKKASGQHGNIRGLAVPEPSLSKFELIARSLAVELGRVRERERQKVADDLHDQIGQNLVLAKMKLDALKSSLGNEHSALAAGISDLINRTIKDTRSLMHELRPDWLSELSLKESLSWLAEQIQGKYQLHCEHEFVSVPKPVKKDVLEVIIQAVRELLVNAAKHAGASKVRIICGCEKGRISIRVVDDGKGFDPSMTVSASPKTGGFGLIIIRARLGLIGGSLYIDSHAGVGTSAMVVCPSDQD